MCICVYIYPFICWWASRLLPCPGISEDDEHWGKHVKCCDEHWGKHVSFSSGFLGVYAREWNCWVIWQFYFQFLKNLFFCFLCVDSQFQVFWVSWNSEILLIAIFRFTLLFFLQCLMCFLILKLCSFICTSSFCVFKKNVSHNFFFSYMNMWNIVIIVPVLMSLPPNFNSCVNSGSISFNWLYFSHYRLCFPMHLCMLGNSGCVLDIYEFLLYWVWSRFIFLWIFVTFSGTVIFLGNNLIFLGVLKVFCMRPAERWVWVFLTAEKVLPCGGCSMLSVSLAVLQSGWCARCFQCLLAVFHVPWPLLHCSDLRLRHPLVFSLSACLCPRFLRYEDSSHTGLGPTIMTSSLTNYIYSDPVLK